jgi:hypothetical protein
MVNFTWRVASDQSIYPDTPLTEFIRQTKGMRFHIPRWLEKAAAGAVAIICFAAMANAQAEDQPPKDCFFDCKEQYFLLKSYGDFTSADAVKAAFGEPTDRAKGKKYEVTKYEGAAGEFFILKLVGSDKMLGVGLFAKDDGAKARIPYLHLGEGEPGTSAYRTFFTLKDITLDYAIQSCPGTVDDIGGAGWVGGQMRIFWTPKCYFGYPGTYMNYSFLFDVPDCKPYIAFPLKKEFRKPSEDKGAFTMEQLNGKPYKCPGLDAMRPTGVFVTHDKDNPAALGPIVFSFSEEHIIE